jgi:hypothetical protein
MDAVDDLSDAIDATRNFLTPVRAGMWLRLAFVVLFVGGTGTGFSSAPSGDVGPVEEQVNGVGPGEVPEEILIGVALGLGVLLLIWAVFAAIAAIMEFVFIESLRSSTVRVRRYFNENVGRGIRLFGFRVIVGLAALVVGGVPLLATLLGVEGTEGLFPAAVVLAIGVYLLYAVVARFTSEFVAPIMLLEERTVLGGWRRFWSTLGSNRTEYVVYLLLVWIIQVVLNIAVTIFLLIGGIVIAIPFVLLAVLFVSLGDVGAVLAALTILVGILVLVLFVLFVRIPIVSYFKYYALLLLGDTDSKLDLIPEQRAAIRTDGGEGELEDDREGVRPADEDRDREDAWSAEDERDRDDRESDADDEDDWTADYGWIDDDEDEMDDWDDADWGERDDREDDRDEDDDRGW